jgi:hypothetical protein
MDGQNCSKLFETVKAALYKYASNRMLIYTYYLGIELRKVETKKEPNSKEDKAGGTYGDVASILARRVAVEMSDSDSGSDSEYDDEWDEASA